MNREFASQYPLLTQFARGYLHQDAAREYPSALTALRRYLDELSPDERVRLSEEWKAFATGRNTLDAWNSGLRDLGGSYDVSNETEMQAFMQVAHRLRT